MFCVLTVKCRRDGLFERTLGFLRKDKYELVTVPVLKAAPFFHLTATVGKKGVDYQKVLLEVGRCAEKLVVENGVDVPKMYGIGEFNGNLLYEKMAENTLKLISKDVVQNNSKIEFDKNDFSLPDYYLKLIPNGVEKYKFASALYELCGAFSLDKAHFNSVIINGEKKSIESDKIS